MYRTGRDFVRGEGWTFDIVSVTTYRDVVRLLERHEDGAWKDVAAWPHEVVEHEGFEVPLWAPDPERAAWRQRKWWGRHLLDVDMAERWWRWAGALPMGQEWEPLRAGDGQLVEPQHLHRWWPS